MILRLVAQHEAAHAVVSMTYGMDVVAVRARPNGGETIRRDAAPPHISAAITAAGDVWDMEFTTEPYRDLGCADLAHLERTVGAAGIWQARRTARTVLQRRRAEVLALADRIERHGSLVAVAGRLVPARSRLPRGRGQIVT